MTSSASSCSGWSGVRRAVLRGLAARRPGVRRRDIRVAAGGRLDADGLVGGSRGHRPQVRSGTGSRDVRVRGVRSGRGFGAGARRPRGEHGDERVVVRQVVRACQVAAAEGVDERVVRAHRGQVDRLVAEQGVEEQVVVHVRRTGVEVEVEVVDQVAVEVTADVVVPGRQGVVCAVRFGGPGSVGRAHADEIVVRRATVRPRLRHGRVDRARAGVVAVAPPRVPHACPPHGPYSGPPHTSSVRHEPLLRIVLALYRGDV